MPAKKTAAKPVKGKKPASRPAARKVAIRKPIERVKASVHPRSPVAASVTRKPSAGARSTPTSAEPVETMRRPAERTESPPSKPIPETKPVPVPARPAAPHPQVASNEADESDAPEPGSLLAGPRNVQPYIVKRGEQYMSKEQSEHFRQILQTWKRDLMEEVRARLFKQVREGDGPKDMLEEGVMKNLPRTWKDPSKFLYDAAKGLWAHHDKLDPNVV